MQEIYSPRAPQAIGPYSHAIRVRDFLFCSGQTPIVPETMKVESVSIEEQTKQVISNLKHVLSAAGLELNDVAKTTVFLTDMDLFANMNLVYETMFNGHRPARSTFAVKELPLKALVEIECIATFKK